MIISENKQINFGHLYKNWSSYSQQLLVPEVSKGFPSILRGDGVFKDTSLSKILQRSSGALSLVLLFFPLILQMFLEA